MISHPIDILSPVAVVVYIHCKYELMQDLHIILLRHLFVLWRDDVTTEKKDSLNFLLFCTTWYLSGPKYIFL